MQGALVSHWNAVFHNCEHWPVDGALSRTQALVLANSSELVIQYRVMLHGLGIYLS